MVFLNFNKTYYTLYLNSFIVYNNVIVLTGINQDNPNYDCLINFIKYPLSDNSHNLILQQLTCMLPCLYKHLSL